MSKRKIVIVPNEEMAKQRLYMEELKNRVSGMSLTYHIVTYGCQMNVHDSENLAGILAEAGYTETGERQEADVVLINTCCVRENAELRVYGNIGSLKAFKQTNPNRIIGVCGCMMQQTEVADYIQKTFPFVDLIFGTHNLHRFPQLLLQALDSNSTIVEIMDSEGEIMEHVPIKRATGVSAWVTIMYGCNNFCSYCIVPYVRGRERSRLPKDILEEINSLAKDGYKEITLIGQNVNSYGKDLEQKYLFHDLLRDSSKIEGIERIRFMTSHPKDLTDKLIYTMAEYSKLSKHIHLPIQSGSNRILREMNRKYTREKYLELVKKLRSVMPDIALTTDIIVGFPGETEEDFQDTLGLIEQVGYDSAFTFLYSPRKGTPAAKKNNQILQEIKKERLARLNNQLNKSSNEKNMVYKDQLVEVLVEGPSKTREDIYTGRTDSNKIVNFEGSTDLAGRLVTIRITKTQTWTLEGEIVQND
ncbi:MAG TPA: tRNA (N6-isopentenyl adenosine(37)-C2)-methylthiotransferase MiaB [Clostridiales bacterium]|nr:tRNA (N6-isopentenyl adenosine(37)-C2)-methylthiotransferase MiaB [Clostridia bacterium]MDD4680159.1 tRNA (N6-isopentenyl adenosine(37)-C2)-methylthiotransferase MiaB [Clostridia bacterium]HCS75476.1 tRNA (N6-isopentenyl adenosine(37)-C2)-methylthiotransferase MiaB [Clostridiales bacterium]